MEAAPGLDAVDALPADIGGPPLIGGLCTIIGCWWRCGPPMGIGDWDISVGDPTLPHGGVTGTAGPAVGTGVEEEEPA